MDISKLRFIQICAVCKTPNPDEINNSWTKVGILTKDGVYLDHVCPNCFINYCMTAEKTIEYLQNKINKTN